MKKFLMSLMLLAAPAFAQVQPNTPFPDQAVGITTQYDQASTTPLTGGVFYAKLTSRDKGILWYTLIKETAVDLKPKFAVQTQTETGVCVYTIKFAFFDVFTCGTGGIATAADNTGLSGTGQLLILKGFKNGLAVGVSGGPTYSGAQGKVTYPVGIVFGWGK